MRRYILLVVMTIIMSCTSNSQPINKEIIKEGKSPFLLGKIDKKGLTSKNYTSWFNDEFQDCQLNTDVIKKISKKIKEYNIKVFMGTWCGDSRREVPRFYKVLEAVNFPMNQLSVVAVSREPNLYKQSPNHEEQGLNIHRVPTFIFYQKGKEINRIVESPVISLEEDIYHIIQDKYQSKYHLVSLIHDIIDDDNFSEKAFSLISEFKKLPNNMYELNTYGKVLSSKKKTEEAIVVFELNAKLFPNEPKAYMSLANTLGANGYKKRAIMVLEDALKIHIDNKNLKENLEMIKSN